MIFVTILFVGSSCCLSVLFWGQKCSPTNEKLQVWSHGKTAPHLIPEKKTKTAGPLYTYILLIFMIHVGKYTIHGCYGYDLEKQFSALGDFFWCPARCRGCKLLRVATMGPQTVASGFNLILQPLTKGFRHPNTSSGLVL